jgi:hypothetical protein
MTCWAKSLFSLEATEQKMHPRRSITRCKLIFREMIDRVNHLEGHFQDLLSRQYNSVNVEACCLVQSKVAR